MKERKKYKRVSTQVHTRKLDRLVAHKNMERAGLKRVNKPNRRSYTNEFGATIIVNDGSYFSRHWRETVNVPTIDLRRKMNEGNIEHK